jgi:hypothetical protein
MRQKIVKFSSNYNSVQEASLGNESPASLGYERPLFMWICPVAKPESDHEYVANVCFSNSFLISFFQKKTIECNRTTLKSLLR